MFYLMLRVNNDKNNETKISNKFFIIFLLSLKPINN